MFIFWLETSAEFILSDKNEFRSAKLMKTFQKMLTLHNLQTSIKKSEKRKGEVGLPNRTRKRRKIEQSRHVNLPNELWIKILSYMETKDVFGCFAQINKRFNQLVKDPSALKSLQVKDILDSESFKSLAKVMQHYKNLQDIKIVFTKLKDREFYDPSYWREESERSNLRRRYLKSIMQQALKLPKLISLRMQSEDSLSENTTQFLLSHGKNLEQLELRNLHFEKADNKILANFTKLKSLVMKHGHDSSKEDDLKSIADSCQCLERINFSSLVYVGSRDKGLHYFFQERRQTLKELTIEHCYEVETDSFLKNIANCEKIESVRILEAHFLSNYGLDIISQLPKLQTLELGRLKNFEGLSDHYSKKYKKLSEAPIDLNKFFGQMNTECLRFLKVFDSPVVTEDNVQALSDNGCPKLEKLILEKCPNLTMNDKTLRSLVKSCPRLQNLQFHWKMISEISTQLWNEVSKKIRIQVTISNNILSIEDFIKSKEGMIGQ